ncbi:hypothetical protein [uncultured Clostridium sp.]|uniref:hypothetical protein n=1 Tax=uncultured Clostridium sp. TaxID=59620 RepID=UPI00261ECCE0|nr:hypothetical protein [uncultured Clostridium sp.]
MPDNDKVKLLYDAVSQNYDVGSYDDFNKKLQDPTKRKAFYDGVGKEYNLGDYSTFETKVGGKKKSRSANWWISFKKWVSEFPVYQT